MEQNCPTINFDFLINVSQSVRWTTLKLLLRQASNNCLDWVPIALRIVLEKSSDSDSSSSSMFIRFAINDFFREKFSARLSPSIARRSLGWLWSRDRRRCVFLSVHFTSATRFIPFDVILAKKKHSSEKKDFSRFPSRAVSICLERVAFNSPALMTLWTDSREMFRDGVFSEKFPRIDGGRGRMKDGKSLVMEGEREKDKKSTDSIFQSGGGTSVHMGKHGKPPHTTFN